MCATVYCVWVAFQTCPRREPRGQTDVLKPPDNMLEGASAAEVPQVCDSVHGNLTKLGVCEKEVVSGCVLVVRHGGYGSRFNTGFCSVYAKSAC